MIRTHEEILADIDATLDQLITNSTAFNQMPMTPLFTTEIEALQKTQESLLARLVHMQAFLQKKNRSERAGFAGIEKKIARFGKLNARMIHHFAQGMKKISDSKGPRIGRNRKKD